MTDAAIKNANIDIHGLKITAINGHESESTERVLGAKGGNVFHEESWLEVDVIVIPLSLKVGW
jgi:hypothetical protein